jgi:quinolinate synthase
MLNADSKVDFAKNILALKKAKNAVILAHYYQEPAIQDIADFVGDSLALSKQAASTNADIIVFAGVHFMAETAKILNPTKKVVLPDLAAGCSLAESCSATDFAAFKKLHPNHVCITYINCSAQVKALSDIICTSSNAKKIVESIPLNTPIIFAPDRNLGKYLMHETGRDILLWDGACIVHEAFSFQKLLALHLLHPNAKIIAHPESETDVLKVAHFVGSTKAMLDFVKNDACTEFLIATEVGIIHQMMHDVPHKTFIPVPAKEDNTCACSECAYMKVNTMEKLYNCLLNESPEILLSEELIKKAILPLNKMLDLSN